jgi:hypothetical protein
MAEHDNPLSKILDPPLHVFQHFNSQKTTNFNFQELLV